MQTADFLVIGGGIVGVTAALEAKRRDPGSRVVLLEKEPELGAHASGRNSGVLHAGIYYAPGTLKARLAREGNRRLTGYCVERALPIRRCGKLLIATGDRQQAALAALLERGRANGVELQEVDEVAARELDPTARVDGRAVFSPTTSSVDPAAVMRSLAGDAVAAGVEVRKGEAFVNVEDGVVVTSRGRWTAGYVLNAGGTHAVRIARRFGFGEGYRILPFKGRYLRARPDPAARVHLYPVPDLRYPFLGVHFTVRPDGEVWLGPTATPSLGRESYGRGSWPGPREAAVTAARMAALMASPGNGGLRRLAARELKRHSRRALLAEAGRLARDVPGPRNWTSGPPGIRAQLVRTRGWKLEDDFVYEADDRSCHVLNAVSPGFTCALPLAEHLLDIIEGNRKK